MSQEVVAFASTLSPGFRSRMLYVKRAFGLARGREVYCGAAAVKPKFTYAIPLSVNCRLRELIRKYDSCSDQTPSSVLKGSVDDYQVEEANHVDAVYMSRRSDYLSLY